MVPAEHVCRNFRQQRRILPQLLKLLSTNAPLALPSFSIANRQQIPEGGPLYLLPFVLPPIYSRPTSSEARSRAGFLEWPLRARLFHRDKPASVFRVTAGIRGSRVRTCPG